MGSGMFKPGYSKVQFKYPKMFFIACLLHAGREGIDIYINDYFFMTHGQSSTFLLSMILLS